MFLKMSAVERVDTNQKKCEWRSFSPSLNSVNFAIFAKSSSMQKINQIGNCELGQILIGSFLYKSSKPIRSLLPFMRRFCDWENLARNTLNKVGFIEDIFKIVFDIFCRIFRLCCFQRNSVSATGP